MSAGKVQVPASLRSQASNPLRFSHPGLRAEAESCATCGYMEKATALGAPDQFFCHRNPPQLIVVPQQTIEGVMAAPASAFPSVPADQWCGEYRRDPEGTH